MARFSLLLLLFLSLTVTSLSHQPFSHESDPPPPMSGTVSLLPPILSNLGYTNLSMAIPSLYFPWPGPITLFAFTSPLPSSAQTFQEHLAPGLFTFNYLSNLKFGSKLQTSAPNRCLTVTSHAASSKVFVDGVLITRPDLYNDGKIVVHGIESFLAPLSSVSCNVSSESDDGIMSLMLKDVLMRLRTNGFRVVAAAVKLNWLDLLELKNMTVFALDDYSILERRGGGYVGDFRFHVVPNRMMTAADLMKMPVGSVVKSMAEGEHLIVTSSSVDGVRINYAPIVGAEVVYNGRIVVHQLVFGIPHLFLDDLAILEKEV